MSKQLVGLVGWRGMVGSVLMDRMQAEGDIELIEPVFFSTSNAGGKAPAMARTHGQLKDANDIAELSRCDIVITCQGGDYTKEVFPKLRASGWQGHWIDAASALRMEDDAVIVLDPVNEGLIQKKLAGGGKNWIGGNCTNSILLMGLAGLFKAGVVESGQLHDLPGRLGRRRQPHARAAQGHGRHPLGGRRRTCHPRLGHPGHRPQGRPNHPQRRAHRVLRRSPGRRADPLDRLAAGQRASPRKSGRGRPRSTRSWAPTAPSPSMACACASAPCAATRWPSPSS